MNRHAHGIPLHRVLHARDYYFNAGSDLGLVSYFLLKSCKASSKPVLRSMKTDLLNDPMELDKRSDTVFRGKKHSHYPSWLLCQPPTQCLLARKLQQNPMKSFQGSYANFKSVSQLEEASRDLGIVS